MSNIKSKSILIVGGTGFIGYHLAKKSLKKGWKVASISSGKPKKIRHLKKVKYLICDITKKKLLEKKIKKYFNYVVNLGGYVDHTNKKKTFASHYLGCKNLIEVFLKKPPQTFVQIGSCVEYGFLKSPQKENYKSDTKLLKSTYGKAKLLSSKYVVNIFNKKNFPSVVLRLYLAYGPKQDLNRFLPVVIKSCLKNEKFPCSNGNQLRDFTHVNDVVDAIIRSLLIKEARGKIINIGSAKPKKIKNIINDIKKISKGGYPQFGEVKLRKDEILKLYPDTRRAKQILKWKPKISFQIGLKKTINSYKKILAK